MKIRGKKLNAAQRKIAITNGITDLDEYLFVQMKVLSDSNNKHLNQHSVKVQKMVIIHRETGIVKECNMEV